MKLTKRHRANLRKHAKFLYALDDNSKFDMEYVALDANGRLIDRICDVRKCGSVMCSIGYAMLGFPRIAAKHDDWEEFCQDIFGVRDRGDRRAWRFLFSEDWVGTDNTITGAADRITYFLKHGVPEDRWNPEVYRSAS